MCATTALACSPADVVGINSKKKTSTRKTKSSGEGKKNVVTVINMTLIGRQRMLQNALTEAALDSLPGGSGKIEQPNLKEMSYEDRADLVRYHGPDDETGVPAECFFAALTHAGRFIKFGGKKMISNAEMSMLPGFLTIMSDFLPFKNQDVNWTVDKRRAVNPATGGAMCVVRPCFPAGWEIDVEVEIDHSGGIKLEQVRELVATAGRESGLGDHRKKGSFGRFLIKKWKVSEREMPYVEAA